MKNLIYGFIDTFMDQYEIEDDCKAQGSVAICFGNMLIKAFGGISDRETIEAAYGDDEMLAELANLANIAEEDLDRFRDLLKKLAQGGSKMN